jgi:flagellar basal-body rod protein FlgG
MLDALYTAASGMLGQQTALDTIANNLSNVNTVGFKAGRTAFEDLLYNQLVPAAGAAQGNEMGLGSAVSAIQVQMDQGNLQAASGQLDMGVDGTGFFRVQKPDGTTVYTRAGNFDRDGAGQLVTTNGNLVLGTDDKPITFPADANMSTLNVEANGAISVDSASKGAKFLVGTISLATFRNPAGLTPLGGNAYGETVNSGAPVKGAPTSPGLGTLKPGTLEMSNVSAVNEMVGMITTQRAFEAVSKLVQASDEMLGIADGLRR